MANHIHARAFQIFPVDTLYYFCLLRVNDEVTIGVFGISQKAVVVHLYFPLLVAEVDAQLHVLADGL